MDHLRPRSVAPEPAPSRGSDPLAAAFGNASLLGVGFLLVGRRGLAVANAMVTVILLGVLVSVAQPWCEILMLLWCAAVTTHGWFLAARYPKPAAMRGRWQRVVAFGVTAAVVTSVVSLRHDAAAITRDSDDARAEGDCAAVLTAQDEVWLGDRIADAPLTQRDDEAADACRRLATARKRLNTALTGDTGALREGFGDLAVVLGKPGNGKTAEAVLNGFLHGLPTKNPCGDVRVTDWLEERKPTHNLLDRSAITAEKAAPAALAACGDALMRKDSWKTARARYQQLLDQFPKDSRALQARRGVTRATQAIELANVTDLLMSDDGSQPAYCSDPAKYSGAKPIGSGTNRAMFYGGDEDDDYPGKLPGAWKTGDPAKAVLVICMGEQSQGAAVQTCPYRKLTSGGVMNVTFHKIVIPVRVYELRTGRLAADRRIQINGASCPSSLSYSTSYYDIDSGPSPDQYVSPSTSDVRAAFRPLVTGRL